MANRHHHQPVRSVLAGTACALALAFAAQAAQAHTSSFRAVLTGSDPDASGLALITIDYATNVLTYDLVVDKLSSDVWSYHIHSGAAGVEGPSVVWFSLPEGIGNSGRLSGTVTGNPNSLLITELTAPDFYFDVHTSNFTHVDVRGQLAAVPEPEAMAMMLAGLGIVGWSATASRRRA